MARGLLGVAVVVAAVGAVLALPADTNNAKADGALLAVRVEPVPVPGRIMVRPPVRQVEEDTPSAPLPVRTNANVPGRLPGTITFPNERLQQADDRQDNDQDGSSWDSLYDGCGATKQCLGVPKDCDQGRNCRAIVTVLWVNSQLIFRMRASDAKWVAVGVGDTEQMFDTAVVECVDEDPGIVKAYLSYTPPKDRGCVRLSNQDPLATTLRNSKVMNGDIFCEVFRVNDSRVNNKEYNLGSTPYFLQMAFGKSLRSDNTGIGYHGKEGRNAASRALPLTEFAVLGSASDWPMRLHAACMVLAWMFAATAGSLAARYFKAAWGKATICGKAMWFAWHRLFMAATLVLHVVAVLAALIFLRGWSSSSGIHGILGGVTTGLALLQGAGGLLRPGPDHRYRPVFNWAHRGQGFVTHILAIVTIFLAVGLGAVPAYSYAILAVYVVFYVGLHALHSVRGSDALRRVPAEALARRLTEVQSYYFLIVLFGSAAFTIAMLIIVVAA